MQMTLFAAEQLTNSMCLLFWRTRKIKTNDGSVDKKTKGTWTRARRERQPQPCLTN